MSFGQSHKPDKSIREAKKVSRLILLKQPFEKLQVCSPSEACECVCPMCDTSVMGQHARAD